MDTAETAPDLRTKTNLAGYCREIVDSVIYVI